jgi:hypothetical protein
MDVGRRAACRGAAEERDAAVERQRAQQQRRGLQRVVAGQRRITHLLPAAAPLPHQVQHQQHVQRRREQRRQEEAGRQQQQRVAVLEEAQRQAVAGFFELLQDFVVVQAAPREWLLSVPSDHPFLRALPDRRGLRCVAAAPPVE